MKNFLYLSLGAVLFGAVTASAAGILYPAQGGTGNGTIPTYGQLLVGNSGGTYTLTATSSLGISGGSTVGTVSTSTTPILGQLSYWTGLGYPSTLGTVATGTISASGGITATAGQSVIGSGLTIGCTAASAGAAGCLSSADWTTFNGKQAALSFTYPLQNSANTVSLAFGTTTANTWSALQTFNGAASSSSFSVQGGNLYVGGAATSTLQGNTTGTSTLQGFLNVSGINSTSTFSGNLDVAGKFRDESVTSALILDDASGLAGPYGGSNCSANTFAYQINGAGVLTCQAVALGSMVSGTLPIANGGTGLSTIGASSTVLTTNGTSAAWQKLDLGSAIYGVLPVANGGTASSTPLGGILAGNGSSAIQSVVVGTGLSYNPVTFGLSNAGVVSLTGGNGISCSGINPGSCAISAPVSTANGGTGTTTWQTGSILYFDGTKLTENNANLLWTNTGTKLTATNASTTNFSASTSLFIPSSSSQAPLDAGQLALDTTNDQLVVGDGSATAVFDRRRNLTLSYATTTAWTGTTTLPLFVIPQALTWNTVQCITDVGTLNVQYQYGTVPTKPAVFNASTTIGTITWTTNNTPSAGATSTIAFGTPVSSPTQISLHNVLCATYVCRSQWNKGFVAIFLDLNNFV